VVAAAIGGWRAQLATSEVPDTGTLRGDIEALIVMVPDFGDAERQTISVILGAATAASRDPALAAALDEHVLGRSREVLGGVLARAVARGEIPPGRDLTLVPDVLLGLNALRLVTGRPAGRAFIRKVFEDVVLPLVTAPVPAPPPAGPRRSSGR
jgi:hypothetical protein